LRSGVGSEVIDTETDFMVAAQGTFQEVVTIEGGIQGVAVGDVIAG
jgi:hypothetical protein